MRIFIKKVGDEIIWESSEEKLLGLIIDNKLSFNDYLMDICKKASNKVTAMKRLARIVPFEKRIRS